MVWTMDSMLWDDRDIQTLLYVVDHNTSTDPDYVFTTLRHFEGRIGKARWVLALQYTEHRIEPISTELNLLLTRVRDLARAMGGNPDGLMSSTWNWEIKSSDLTRHSEQEELTIALRNAIVALATRKETREATEERLERDLEKWRAGIR